MTVDSPTPARRDLGTVLVTGASGFLGSHLTRALRSRGIDVVGTSRRKRDADGSGVRWLQADPSDLAQVRRVIGHCRPDCVFHLSSLADGKPDLALVEATLQAEVVSTLHVLTAAAESNVGRLVLAGSFEAPDAGAAPGSPYAAAKAASHLYARMFHLLYSIPVVTARIFMTYGRGQPAWKLIPSVTASFLAGIAPQIGSASRPVDWIYVSDTIAGLIRLAEVEGLEGRTIDIGTGSSTTIREVVEMLRALTGASVEPLYAATPMRPQERLAHADVAATAHALGWQPEVSLQEGLKRTVDALRAGHAA